MNGLIVIVVHAFRRVLLPLGTYYAVTVAIPLANGAAQSGATFWQHTLAVLVAPPAIVVLVCVAYRITGARRSA